MKLNSVPLFVGAMLGAGCYLAFGPTVAGIAVLAWLAFTIVITVVG